MHAHPPNEAIASFLDHCERSGRKLSFCIRRKTMDLFAGLLTTPAADALSYIHQDGSSVCHESSPFCDAVRGGVRLRTGRIPLPVSAVNPVPDAVTDR